jgi:cobalt-zinc-cadmium efflux system outer membrane protein
MRSKLPVTIGVILAIVLSSAPGSRADAPEPKPYALGKELGSFQAPGRAQQAEDSRSLRVEEPTGVITLREALALALMKSPELAAFSWEARAREAQALQARLFPNPELDVEVENFAGTGALGGLDDAETTVQLGQLVELGGKRSKRKRAAALDQDLAGWDYELGRILVFTETSKAFVDVLVAQKRTELNQEFVRLAEQVLDVVAERVRAGKTSPVEEIKARVALSARLIDKRNAEEELAAARTVLAAAWGGTAPTFSAARGDLERSPEVPSFEALSGRVSDNPEMARWLVEIEKLRASLETERAGRFPDITLRGGVRHISATDDWAFVAGLSVPIPVFNRNQGATMEAQYRVAKAEEQRRALHLRVQAALVSTYRELSSARNEAVSLKNEVLPGARRAFEATGEGFRQGKFGYLEVLDAQRTFFEAQARYTEALGVLQKAVADAEGLLGEPLHGMEDPAGGITGGETE